MNEQNIKIEDIIDALKKRWQLIVGITLAATILSAAVSFFLIKPKYQASTKLFVGKEETSTNQNYNSSDIQLYQQILKTYSDVITTNDLITRALENEGIKLSSGAVLGNLSVVPKTGTQIMEIMYVSKNKEEAAKVVEAVTDEFVKTSPELIKNANVKVIEKVKLPGSPISPNKKLNIAIAMLLGLMVGVGLALLMEFMDSTFKDKDVLENIIGVPVLGMIPNEEKVK